MQTRIIILAGGKGNRMQSELPKVLIPLRGMPIIAHLLREVDRSGIDPRPVVVVGQGADAVKRALGSGYDYVIQESQLGTGHAVQCAEGALAGKADAVIVLYGDHPFVSAATITKLRELHEREGCVLTMMTVRVPDFDDWRKVLYDFGRIIRDNSGRILRDVEKKDATPEELAVKEVNPSFFCFRASWLWENLRKLKNENAQHEYYLTDLVRIAIDEGERIASMDIDPRESIGVNTPEHLALVIELAT